MPLPGFEPGTTVPKTGVISVSPQGQVVCAENSIKLLLLSTRNSVLVKVLVFSVDGFSFSCLLSMIFYFSFCLTRMGRELIDTFEMS